MASFSKNLRLVVLVLLLGLVPSSALGQVLPPSPVASPMSIAGPGLCVVYLQNGTPQTTLISPFNLGDMNGNPNPRAFLDAFYKPIFNVTGVTFAGTWNQADIKFGQVTFADFLNSLQTKGENCAAEACPLPSYGPSVGVIARYRGFLNVTTTGPINALNPEPWVNKIMHLGLIYGPAAQWFIFDKTAKSQTATPLGSYRPSLIGNANWRTVVSIAFHEAGLYPIEVDYVSTEPGGVIESAYLSPSTPNQLSANDINQQNVQNSVSKLDPDNLAKNNFLLMDWTMFFQTTKSGGVNCTQCDRMWAGVPGGGEAMGCTPSTYCNLAALCEPCRLDNNHCGSTCAICSPPSTFCVPDGTGDYQCSKCQTKDRCGGNSCNCCSGGTQCLQEPHTSEWMCAGCFTDADCANQTDKANKYCDVLSQQCISQAPSGNLVTNTDTYCGTQSLNCPQMDPSRPYCLDGSVCVQCRNDLDCQLGGGPSGNSMPGNFCLSGLCVECTTDLRCGTACLSCGGNQPYCYPSGNHASSFCTRCYEDSQCPGGTCVAGSCAVGCSGDSQCDASSGYACSNNVCTCAPNTKCSSMYQSSDTAPGCNPTASSSPTYPYGKKCVGCYTSSQCPCGGTCTNNSCNGGCNDNSQCNGDQCCDPLTDTGSPTAGQCFTGSCSATGAAPCCSAAPLGLTPLPGHPAPTLGERHRSAATNALVGLLGLGSLWLFLRARRRQRLAADGRESNEQTDGQA